MTTKAEFWVIDDCPDANGYATIRVDDGTENGDTSKEPIATVFDWCNAEMIVHNHNISLD